MESLGVDIAEQVMKKLEYRKDEIINSRGLPLFLYCFSKLFI